MKEQLVSFETAKLAKEKGFDIHCPNFYFEDGEFRKNELTGTNGYYGEEYCFEQEEFLENWNDGFLTNKLGDRCFGCKKSNNYFETFSAPTQSLLQKWLREVHNIDVISYPSFMGKQRNYYYVIFTNRDFENYMQGLSNNYSYEEALEIGFKEALTYIKLKNEN